MIPDAEVITVAVEILSSLPIGEFTLKLNHRGLLDAVLDIAGVPAAKFRPICSAIDKLDKEPWAAVREEMIAEKGLLPAVADRVGEMVVLSGKPNELLARLHREAVFGEADSRMGGGGWGAVVARGWRAASAPCLVALSRRGGHPRVSWRTRT
jgi:histidyl-tRNA synthetase